MKNNLKLLPILTAVLGLAGLGLRKWLYAAAVDEKNLLVLWHPLAICLWVVTIAALALVLLGVRGTENLRGYHRNVPPTAIAAGGSFVMAAGLVLTALQEFRSGTLAAAILGAAGAAGLVTVGICRLRRRRPSYVYHALACLFFAVYLISSYRTWSGHPQLEDYIYSMFSCVGLMLFAYQQTAFDGGYGSRKVQLATGLLTAYFCLVALSDGGLLFGAGALWTLTNLCSTAPNRGEQGVA